MTSALYSYRNLIYTYCRRLNVNPLYKVDNTRAFAISMKAKSEPILPSHKLVARRCLSSQSNPDDELKRSYTPLMEYPEIIWPNMFHMIGCWFNFKMKVEPLESEFNVVEFVDGTRHAIVAVSDALSREDYESLEGLVTPEAIEILKRNISRMSDDEKRQIVLKENEYFLGFPWNVNVRSVAGKSSKVVEVLMVHHFLRNWKDQPYPKMMETDRTMQRLDIMNSVVGNPDYIKHAIVGNYRFIREFGSEESSWYINLVNQFKIDDLQK